MMVVGMAVVMAVRAGPQMVVVVVVIVRAGVGVSHRPMSHRPGRGSMQGRNVRPALQPAG